MDSEKEVAQTIRELLVEALEEGAIGCGLDSVEQHPEYPDNGFTVTSGRHVFAVTITKVK